MKNITLSAPEELIEFARKEAIRKNSTLNEEFRKWLAQQAKDSGNKRAQNYRKMLKEMSHVDSGGPFTRDEMNER